MSPVRASSAFLAAMALIAAASAGPVAAQQPAAAGMSEMKSPADADMMQGMAKMDKDMAAAPMTGNPDKDFVAMMLPHHQGAVDMAQVELRYGKDPAMLKLAREIVAAQDREIALMKAWEAQHPTP